MNNKYNYNNIDLQKLIDKPVKLSKTKLNVGRDEFGEYLELDYNQSFFKWILISITDRIFIFHEKEKMLYLVYYIGLIIAIMGCLTIIAHFILITFE